MTTIDIGGTMYGVRFISRPGGEAVTIHMDDTRKISAIAAEFEGVGRFTASDTLNPKRVIPYEGYEVLEAVERYRDGSVMIRLAREE